MKGNGTYYTTASDFKSQFVEMFGGKETSPIANYVEDSFPGEWGTEDIDGTGVKVIRTTNFTNKGKLNLAEIVTRNIDQKKIDKKQIKKYDTILERSGGTNDNPVGRVVLFEEDGLFLSNNFTQILRFKDIDPRFAFYSLFYFYQSNKIKIRSMGAKTTGIQNLNMKKYLEIEIPKVSIAEQEQFVRIANQADKSLFELKKSIAAIDLDYRILFQQAQPNQANVHPCSQKGIVKMGKINYFCSSSCMKQTIYGKLS